MTTSLMIGCLALVVGFPDAEPATRQAAQVFEGNVVPLKTLLEKQGIKSDPKDDSLVLVTGSGRIYPLVKDEGSRPFFLDARLQNRPMHLKARLVKGSELLVVSELFSVKNGQLHEIYYWCEVCQLQFREAGPCTCCGGKTELFEIPVSQAK